MRKKDRRPEDIETGYRLARAREALGYSEVKPFARALLAAMAQATDEDSVIRMRNSLYQCESGKSGITQARAKALENAFGITRRYLFDGEVADIRDDGFRRKILEQMAYEPMGAIGE